MEAKFFIACILVGLEYLHLNNIIHRDIKLENIRFAKQGAVDHIRLYDFGSATFYRGGDKIFEMQGNPQYAAPEMLGGLGYDEKVDVWSCGVVFHYLLTGTFPYDEKTDIEVLHKIQTTQLKFDGSRYERISGRAMALLKLLLSKDPYSRISASDACNHPYFTNDDLDREILRAGLNDCRRFLLFGPI